MIRQFCDSIIDTRVPQEPPLGVVNEIAMAGKADGGSDVGSWCPTRFIGATPVAAVNHVESVYARLTFRIGGGRNSRAGGEGRQRQDGNQEGVLNFWFHEILHSKTAPLSPALAAGLRFSAGFDSGSLRADFPHPPACGNRARSAP